MEEVIVFKPVAQQKLPVIRDSAVARVPPRVFEEPAD
jgi:hypothetical protein